MDEAAGVAVTTTVSVCSSVTTDDSTTVCVTAAAAAVEVIVVSTVVVEMLPPLPLPSTFTTEYVALGARATPASRGACCSKGRDEASVQKAATTASDGGRRCNCILCAGGKQDAEQGRTGSVEVDVWGLKKSCTEYDGLMSYRRDWRIRRMEESQAKREWTNLEGNKRGDAPRYVCTAAPFYFILMRRDEIQMAGLSWPSRDGFWLVMVVMTRHW